MCEPLVTRPDGQYFALGWLSQDLWRCHRAVHEDARGTFVPAWSLRRAIAASAAIPGIFPPVHWDEMLLCDLGGLGSLPTTVAESYGSDIVIGVDVGPERDLATHCDSALHVLLRMDEIRERLVRRHSQARADVLSQPPVGMCPWFAFSEPEWLITAG